MVVCPYNPSTQESEVGGLRIPDQPGLCLKKQQKRIKREGKEGRKEKRKEERKKGRREEKKGRKERKKEKEERKEKKKEGKEKKKEKDPPEGRFLVLDCGTFISGLAVSG
jgi:hypothetical protein